MEVTFFHALIVSLVKLSEAAYFMDSRYFSAFPLPDCLH